MFSINWTGKDELYDIGMIYKQQYIIEIQKMQEWWFDVYLALESRWNAKIQHLKQQVEIMKLEKKMFQLVVQLIGWKAPSVVYPIYLDE